MPAQRANLEAIGPSDTATIRIEENKQPGSPQKPVPEEPVRLAVSPMSASPLKSPPPPPPNVPRTSLHTTQTTLPVAVSTPSSSPQQQQRASLINTQATTVLPVAQLQQRASLINTQATSVLPVAQQRASLINTQATSVLPVAHVQRASLINTQATTVLPAAQRSSLINTPSTLSSQRPSLINTQTSLTSPSSPRLGPLPLGAASSHGPGTPHSSAPNSIKPLEEGIGATSSSIGKHASFQLSSEGESFEVTVFQPQTKSIMKKTATLIEGPDGELEIAPEDPPPSPVGPPGPLKHVGFSECVDAVEPEDEDHLDAKSDSFDRGKSVDYRGQELDLEGEIDENEDPEAKRASYKERLRSRGERKGRSFQPRLEQQEKGQDVSPQEAAFTAETEQLVRNRDQVEIDVYALEQDIREKSRELEAKKKQLTELLTKIRARPFVWARVLDPNAPEPPSDKPSESGNGSPRRQRGSVAQTDSDPRIVRIHVQKIGTFLTKDAKRVLELNQLIKIISLHKLKREGRTSEVIHAHQIHSCKPPDKNSLILNFKYYGDSDRKLLRSQKDLKLKFDTIFERERIFRILREMLPTEKRASSFTYSPQPLPISNMTQDRVNALPVFKLAAVLHDAWIERKESMGWKHGSFQDEVEKTHPQMKVFEKLTPEDQKFCMGMATLTLAGIFELGYSITKAQGNQKGFAPQLRSLIEFLAENAHESWADIKIKAGWKHDSRADSTSKSHPDLIPYCDLDEMAKEPDREAALTIISSLIKWGYCITRNNIDNFDSEPN